MYEEYNDYELIDMIRSGNEESLNILFEKYNDLVKVNIPKYNSYASGICSDDLFQAGMLGINDAIMNFKDDKAANFKTYAVSCIRRRMSDLSKYTNTKKHKTLNESTSFDDVEIIDRLTNLNNPANILEDMEDRREFIDDFYVRLTKFEKEVVGLLIEGFKNEDIALKLGKSYKSISNAKARIRLKFNENYNKKN